MACTICSAPAQAVVFLDRERLVSHSLGDLWLLVNHGWLVKIDIVVLLAAIDGGRVIRHGL